MFSWLSLSSLRSNFDYYKNQIPTYCKCIINSCGDGVVNGFLLSAASTATVAYPVITVSTVSSAIVLSILDDNAIFKNLPGRLIGNLVGHDQRRKIIFTSGVLATASSFLCSTIKAKWVLATFAGGVCATVSNYVYQKLKIVPPTWKVMNKDAVIKAGIISGIATPVAITCGPMGMGISSLIGAMVDNVLHFDTPSVRESLAVEGSKEKEESIVFSHLDIPCVEDEDARLAYRRELQERFERIIINVKTVNVPNIESFSLKMDRRTDVESLYKTVEEHFGYRREDMSFIYKGHRLNDDLNAISSYGIVEGSMLHLVLKPDQKNNDWFYLYIKKVNFSHHLKRIEARPAVTMARLFEAVSAYTGYTSDDLVFVHEGRKLEDLNKTLSEYGVSKDHPAISIVLKPKRD